MGSMLNFFILLLIVSSSIDARNTKAPKEPTTAAVTTDAVTTEAAEPTTNAVTTESASTAGASTAGASTVGASTAGASTAGATTVGASTAGATKPKATTAAATTVKATTEQQSTIVPPSSAENVELQFADKDGTVFIYLEFDATFNITYTEKKSPIIDDEAAPVSNATVYLPSELYSNTTTLDALCQTITVDLQWYASPQAAHLWTFSLTYTLEKGGTTNFCKFSDKLDKTYDYELSGMSLTYFIDDYYFPNAKQADGTEMIASNDTLSYFETDTDSSYSCETAESYYITDDVSIILENYHSQAFEFSDNGEFDTAKTCDADNDDGSTVVPIVVGCVLAGLIIITLVAYFIGRWRQNKQNGYQTL